MFKHILVPTDGSHLSQMAVHHAVIFAKENGARITVLYAKPEYPITFYVEGIPIDPNTSEQFDEHAEAHAQEILNFAERCCIDAGVPCTKLAVTSDIPYEVIVEAAKQNACDLIFMASHGRRGIGGLLLGSETNRVLTHSTVPVLVYR